MSHPPSAPDQKLRVFVSYSRRDRAFAERIVAALEARGLQPRIDTKDLPKLEDWRRELLGFIREADAVVFVVSSQSVASPVCTWEIEQVASLNKRLAPIVIERVPDDRIPGEISKINYLFFDPPNDFEEQVEALAGALQSNLAWIKEHTRIAELGRRWQERNRNKSLLLRGQDLEDAQRWIALHPRGAPEPTELHRRFVVSSRRGAVRRQRAIIAGSLLLAVFGLGLAGVAFSQWQQALEQTARATQNYAAAKTAADGLINNLAKNLRNVRGVSQETTRTLLTAASSVMDRLASTTSSTRELYVSQIELDLQFALTYWFVGDVTNALQSTRRGIAASDRLLSGKIDQSLRTAILNLRYDLQIEQGNILRVMGQLDTSLDSFREALETAGTLALAAGDDDKKTSMQIARAHGRIGDVMRSYRRFAEAEVEYRIAERIQNSFLAAAPDDPDWKLELSWTFNRLADNFLHVTNHEGLMTVAADRTPALKDNPNLVTALAHYEKSVALRRQLMAVRGQDTRNLRDFIWSCTLYGMALLALDTTKALAALDEPLREVSQALEVDPKNTELMRYQANAYNFHGDALLISGDMSAAFTNYARGLKIRQGLSDTDPNNARWLRDLFYTLKRMVELHRITGDSDAAERYRLRARELGARASTRFPLDKVLAVAVDELGD